MEKKQIGKYIKIFSILCLGSPVSTWAMDTTTKKTEETTAEAAKTLDSLTNIPLLETNTVESTTNSTVPETNESTANSTVPETNESTANSTVPETNESTANSTVPETTPSIMEDQQMEKKSEKNTVAYLTEYFETEYVSSVGSDGKDRSFYRLNGIKKLYEGNKIIIPSRTEQDNLQGMKIPVQFSSTFFDNLRNGNGFDKTKVIEISSVNSSSSVMYVENYSAELVNLQELFKDYINLEKYDVSLSWYNITSSLARMFFGLSKLTYVNLGFVKNMDNVSDLSEMFSKCNSLREVYGLEGNFSKVTSIRRMFFNCGSLKFLNRDTEDSFFNLPDSAVLEDMSWVFYGCNSLSSLTMNINTNKLRDISHFIHQTGDENRLKSFKLIPNDSKPFSQLELAVAMFQNDRNLSNVQINSSQENTIDFSNSFNLQSVGLDYMFYKAGISYIDLKLPNDLSVDATYSFWEVQKTPLVVITNNQSLQRNDYISDNRIPSGPIFEANGGQFDNQQTTKTYFDSCAISSTDPKLQLTTFQQFKQDIKPTRDNYLFESWQLTEGSEPVNDVDLFNASTYTAQWAPSLEHGNIPSQDIDNVKPDTTSIYGIAYMPKAFTISSTKLMDETIQNIPINSTSSYHVAVRDQRMTQDGWTLQAQLVWDNNELQGSYVQTTNGKGKVKKNTNNGSTDFQLSDLVDNDGTVTGEANVKISNTPTSIMTGQNVSHNGVYDYDLGKVSLVLENANTIQSGNYTGNINWNLTSAP